MVEKIIYQMSWFLEYFVSILRKKKIFKKLRRNQTQTHQKHIKLKISKKNIVAER